MNDRISSFNPIIDEQSKILILGSVPGVKSLEQQEYYAHPQNKFWTIIFELLDEEFTLNYDLKLNILKQNKIALAGTIIVVFFILIAFLAPLIAPYGINGQCLLLFILHLGNNNPAFRKQVSMVFGLR